MTHNLWAINWVINYEPMFRMKSTWSYLESKNVFSLVVLERITMKKLSKMKFAEPWNVRPSFATVSARQTSKLSKSSNAGKSKLELVRRYILDFSDWGYCFIDFKNHKQAALAKRIGIRDLFEGKEKVVFMIFLWRYRSFRWHLIGQKTKTQ